jgi:trimeric intracellular cation channel
MPNFHKRHPLACYISSMLLCFGGGMIVHCLLGEPLLDDFKTHHGLVLATVSW